MPGAEPEDPLTLDVPALIVPQDESHAPSAARYLQECLPLAEYWDVPVAEQTEQTALRGSSSSSTRWRRAGPSRTARTTSRGGRSLTGMAA